MLGLVDRGSTPTVIALVELRHCLKKPKGDSRYGAPQAHFGSKRTKKGATEDCLGRAWEGRQVRPQMR